MKKSTRLWLLALALALACACLPLAAFAAGTQSAQNSSAGGYAFAATKATSLATPKITKAESTASGVKLTWGKVAGAAKYRVFYKKGGKWTKLADTTSTSYTWKKAKSGAKYTFTVRCLSKDGKKYTSGYNKAGKSITYKKPASTLATPKLSKVENVAGGVKVTWGKVSGAAKYRVFYKTGSGSWKKAGDTTSTSYTWKKAKSGTKYTFTVRCLSKDGKKYTSGYNKTGKAITCIAAPTITKLESTASGVKVTWGKVAGAAKYRVFYKKGGKWTKLADTTSTSYTWKGAKSGTKYTFTVRCLSKDAKSYTSAYNTAGKAVTFKAPAAQLATPKITKLENLDNSIRITWGRVSGAAQYRVFYKTGSGGWTKLTDTTICVYTWNRAQDGTKYTFTVRCLSKDGKSYTSGYDTTGKSITYRAAGVPIDASRFPDITFLLYVREHFDKDDNGVLSAAERDAVTAIEIRNSGVRDLRGIENFANLTSLDCSNDDASDGKLSTLDMSANKKLKYLDCNGGQLSRLDVSGNPELLILDVGDNDLDALDVSKNTKLEALVCERNQLTELDVSHNKALKQLNASLNGLAALDVGNNTKLQLLYCSNNQLKKLDVGKNTELQKLYCGYNDQLAALDVSKNTKLQVLDCSYDQLTKLDVRNITGLQGLHCQKNKLVTLDLGRKTALKDLVCTDNQLEALDLSTATALERLHCGYNQLPTLDVGKSAKLQELDCFDNQLTKLDLGNNPALKVLDCRFNSIQALDLSKNPLLTGKNLMYDDDVVITR